MSKFILGYIAGVGSVMAVGAYITQRTYGSAFGPNPVQNDIREAFNKDE